MINTSSLALALGVLKRGITHLLIRDYHCGICELTWNTSSKPTKCPHCQSDEIELRRDDHLEWEWSDPEYDEEPRYADHH